MNAKLRSPIEVAAEAWGEAIPIWVEDLARECASSSQAVVARRMGRSDALISTVLRAKYRGDLEAVEEVFKGAYQGAEVDCPALGALPANDCRDWRAKSRRFVNVNALRVRMFRACKGCPRNMKEVKE